MKIGFLAMSGIRAHDPKLLELGLTLPGFVERSRQVAALPSLGLLMLAAVTPQGHELIYGEAPAEGQEPGEFFECDLVAISTFSAQIFEAYSIADRLRAAGVRVALGGLHVSARPLEALEHADYVVVGEGENVWPAVVDAAAHGAAPRLFRAADFGAVDFANLPQPRYDLLRGREYNRITLQTSRGCPWRCDFCASTIMLEQRPRRRSIAGIERDLDAILRLRPNAFLELADDNTFVDKLWGRELATLLARRGVPWFTETDISVADDPLLLDLLAESHCRQLLIGLESPRAGSLSGIELRGDFKARRAASAKAAIRAIQSRGITVNGCFVLGLDGDGPEVFEDVAEFAREVGLYEVQITYMTAFPGTPLHDRLERESRLLHPGAWQLCTLFDVNVRPSDMSVEQLREGMYRLSQELYSKSALRERRRTYFAQRRARKQVVGGRRAV